MDVRTSVKTYESVGLVRGNKKGHEGVIIDILLRWYIYSMVAGKGVMYEFKVDSRGYRSITKYIGNTYTQLRSQDICQDICQAFSCL